MNSRIWKLFQEVKEGSISPGDAAKKLKDFPYENLGFARVDHHRSLRQGYPEVIFCQGKDPAEAASIARSLASQENNVLGTRADIEVFTAVQKVLPDAQYHSRARVFTVRRFQPPPGKPLLVVSAGTADTPVAEEAVLTAEMLGDKPRRLYDVGVAGLHRLLDCLHLLEEHPVLIVVAGMEGALASVIGGLTDKPVIAVPTSVGYGAHFQGLAPLLGMLNTCAPGVGVVNIDNGFGAATLAHAILKLTRCD